MEEELPMRVDNKGEQLIGDRLKALKREVKQIMEEAVTRKFINEESSSVTSLCAAVESCLQHGLKKKVLGLFGSVSTFGLLLKISKMCPPANAVVKIVLEMEQKYFKDHKPQTNGVIDLEKFKRHSSGSVAESSSNSRPPTDLPGAYRYLWIRVALFEKLLAIIVDYLANNASKFYEKEALMMDPVASTMTASLLVGPCALDYSKMKTQDHLWTDPPADELMQRHKIQPYSSINRVPSGNLLSPRSPRPSLNVKRTGSLGPDEATQRLSGCARDYVMSLHQNYKATLLYGKNNVSVHPAECKAPLKGYLALYQAASGSLMVRWTPNELVHSKSEPVADESDEDKSYMWKFALNLNIDDIVYIHVHQQADTGGGIIFVGADGVQHPPIQFPVGQHPLSFLTCLETGLLPWGQLEPPLWLQRGKGKVFPKLKRRTSVTSPPTISANVSFSSVVVDNDTFGDSLNSTTPVGRQNSDSTEFPFETNDFVFRIIPVNKPSVSKVVPPKSKFIHSDSEPSKNSKVVSITGFSSKLKDRILSLSSMSPPSIRNPFVNSLTITPSSEGSPAVTPTFKSLECVFEGQPTTPDINPTPTADNHISTDDNTKAVQSASPKQDRSLKSVCDSMRHQILCRAFYGWLAHCRHLRTIRTHLACLVELNNNVSVELTGEVQSTLTREEWEKILATKTEDAKFDLYKRIYLGCVEDNELRKDVWPYLLGFFKFEATPEQNQRLLDQTQTKYESTVTDWLSVEAIVKQRDIEAFKAARQARESRYSDIPLVGKQSISLSNDVVFESEDDDIDEYLATDTIPSSRAVAKRSKAAKGPVEVGSKPEAEPTASVADSDSGICALGEFKEELKSIGEANESLEDTDKSPDSVMLSPGTNAHPPLSAKNSNELPDATDLRQRKMFYVTDSGRSTPEEGDGGIFSKELIETFALNLHRIEKDVLRCDRNYFYFTQSNLEKLKNIMCTYVWNHLDIGYIQGMCDLAAPLLVIFDDEVMAYGCFCELMHRMAANFPHGGQMDIHFANMRALIQVLDPELFDLMHQNGDYTHFYFCYRWFLLDFKRELVYADVFRVWEVIWAACHVSSQHFVLFLALALVQHYRDIILENNMDFTDIIKFFNEMAEKHDANLMMKSARSLVAQLQTVIKSNSH